MFSEMQEAAALRLVAYWKDDDNNFANARFLDLKNAVGEGGDCKVTFNIFALFSLKLAFDRFSFVRSRFLLLRTVT